MKAPTIFITGISASGKSTLGKILKENLEENGTHNIIFLDGEAMRMKFKERGKHFGFSNEERKRFAIEIAHLAVEYNEKGIICIISALCHIKNTRLNRDINGIGMVSSICFLTSATLFLKRPPFGFDAAKQTNLDGYVL